MLKTLKRSHTSFRFTADASVDESGSLRFMCEGEAESQRCFILLKGLKSKPPPSSRAKQRCQHQICSCFHLALV